MLASYKTKHGAKKNMEKHHELFIFRQGRKKQQIDFYLLIFSCLRMKKSRWNEKRNLLLTSFRHFGICAMLQGQRGGRWKENKKVGNQTRKVGMWVQSVTALFLH